MPKKFFIIDHCSLIIAAKKLNYPADESGICRGFTMAHIESILTGNTKKFLERAIRIVRNLDNLLLKEEFLKGQQTPEAEQLRLELLDINAFFESVCLYQKANLSSQILEEWVSINDIEKISAIASSEEILDPDKYDGIKPTPIWQYGKFDIETIEPLLIELQQQIQNSAYFGPVPFLLDLISASDCGHSLCITYNPLDSTWQSLDANHFPPINPEKNIKLALTHLPFQYYESFSIRAILPKKTFPHQLVNQMLKISAHSNTIYCLYHAVINLNLAAVTSLLTKGINPNISIRNGLSLLHIAAYYGHYRILEQLLKWGTVTHIQNKNGNTALHIAAKHMVDDEIHNRSNQYRHYKLLKLLLRWGADVNIQNKEGYTALHIAASNVHYPVVKLFLIYGANMNARAEAGDTPLHVAAKYGCHQVVNQLLIYGANVNARNQNAFTALHIALINRHDLICRKLLKWGADANIQNKEGNTALHVATYLGRHHVIKQLLKSGADANTKNIKGLSPIFLAAYQGHIEAVKVLLANPGLNITTFFFATPKFLMDLVATISTKASSISSKMEEYIKGYQRNHQLCTHIKISPQEFFLITAHPDSDLKHSIRL